MDLDTLRQRVKSNRYKNREEFMKDTDLILTNCIQYNGLTSNLTTIATNMIAAARAKLEEQCALLDVVEKDILEWVLISVVVYMPFILSTAFKISLYM